MHHVSPIDQTIFCLLANIQHAIEILFGKQHVTVTGPQYSYLFTYWNKNSTSQDTLTRDWNLRTAQLNLPLTHKFYSEVWKVAIKQIYFEIIFIPTVYCKMFLSNECITRNAFERGEYNRARQNIVLSISRSIFSLHLWEITIVNFLQHRAICP